MIKFAVDGKEGFECGRHCPAMKMFKPKRGFLEVPDIYDDYFRRYTSSRYENVQEGGVAVLNGVAMSEFFDFIMDVMVYAAEKISERDLVDGYEQARRAIDNVSKASQRKKLKIRMLKTMAKIHGLIRKPGEDVESLQSFGAFVHLLVAGSIDYLSDDMEKSDAKITILHEQELEVPDVFLDFFGKGK